MKITFISQKGPSFIERNTTHIPVDLAQQCALKAHNHHYTQINQIDDDWDIIILLIPKTQEDRDKLYELDLVDLFRRKPLIYKLEDGKYIIDLVSTFNLDNKK